MATKQPPADEHTIARTIDGLEERLSAVRLKGDTNNRAELRDKSQGLIDRLCDLRNELGEGKERQAIERGLTEIMEDTNSLERSAGTSPR